MDHSASVLRIVAGIAASVHVWAVPESPVAVNLIAPALLKNAAVLILLANVAELV